MNRFRGPAEAVALVVTALVLFYVVGALNPLTRAAITTDTLGPDNGEPVAEYLVRATDSVDTYRDDPDLHWTMATFDAGTSPADAYDAAGGERIAQVLVRVPLERVQTPVVAVAVPGTRDSVLASEDSAGTQLSGSMGQWDRQSQIDAASSSRLAAGCDCVVALILYAHGTSLEAIAATPGVRAVEVLPADAVAGKFAVRALLPEHIDVVAPLPDDGPVPPP